MRDQATQSPLNKEQLRVVLRKALAEDLFALAKALGIRTDNLAPVHYETARIVGDRTRKKNKLILLPRGHLKSTFFCVVQAIQDIIRFPNERQLIASATLSLSYSLLGQVKALVEQHADFLHWVYPEIFWKNPSRESPVWRNNALLFKRTEVHKEATIEIASTEKSITGRHYDKIHLDDIVAEANSGTEDQLKKVIEWYQMLTPIIDKRSYGYINITGTRWHLNDVYGWIMENEADQYDIIKHKAHDDTFTNILWEDNFSKGDFLKIQKTMTAYQYSCQYLNEPLAEEEQIFREEQFRYEDFPLDIPRELYTVVMTVDPALSEKEQACNSAIVIMAYYGDKMWHLLDWEDKVPALKLVDKIIDLMIRYDADVVGIETVAYQKMLKEVLIEKITDLGLNLPIIEELKADKDKVRRAYTMQAYVMAGRVNLNIRARRLIKELVEFPQGRNKDLVDAFVYQSYLFPLYNKRISIHKQATHNKALETQWHLNIKDLVNTRSGGGYDFSK